MSGEPFDAKLSCIWMGAFFFWMLKGFRGRFAAMLGKEREERNFWTGYGITLLLVAGFVLLFIVRR